jgi:hypothetical protein
MRKCMVFVSAKGLHWKGWFSQEILTKRKPV